MISRTATTRSYTKPLMCSIQNQLQCTALLTELVASIITAVRQVCLLRNQAQLCSTFSFMENKNKISPSPKFQRSSQFLIWNCNQQYFYIPKDTASQLPASEKFHLKPLSIYFKIQTNHISTINDVHQITRQFNNQSS